MSEKKSIEILDIGCVLLTATELVITGTPPDEDEVADEDYGHNCDAMGCGWEHVLMRIPRASVIGLDGVSRKRGR